MRFLRWALPLAVLVVIGALGIAVFTAASDWLRRDTPTTTAGPGPGEKPFALQTGVLDVSTITSPQETFDRHDPLTFWNFDFGTTVSQIRVKAVFRYHVPLDPKGWHVKRVGDQFRVIVPAVKPSLPVAIDTATLQKNTTSGWLRFNKAENLDALEKDLTALLEKRAAESRNIELQRPKARQAAKAFVMAWLTTREGRGDVKLEQIRVFFADEPIERMDSMATNF